MPCMVMTINLLVSREVQWYRIPCLTACRLCSESIGFHRGPVAETTSATSRCLRGLLVFFDLHCHPMVPSVNYLQS